MAFLLPVLFHILNSEKKKKEKYMEYIILFMLVLITGLLIINLVRMNRKDKFPIEEIIKDSETRQINTLVEYNKRQEESLSGFRVDMIKDSAESQNRMNTTIRECLKDIQESNEKKLNDIQAGINGKLDESLNDRLDTSFKQIGERLESLYQSLGELKQLENGVNSLNRTLTNVKTRGIFGEIQLGNILANVLDKSQYDENVATKKGSDDRVEYAVKIPDKENKGGFIYLPIDSKFPADIYNRIISASESADASALKSATTELKQRIKTEAMTIRDKYISTPDTTDFALMFLPTEGLYSEVLRIPGLVEECQNSYKIVVSGPSTLTAVLNSLSVGFKYLTVNRKSKEILKTLGAIKTQYGKFTELIDKTQKKLSEAQTATDSLKSRTDMIQRKLGKIDILDEEEANDVLEIK